MLVRSGAFGFLFSEALVRAVNYIDSTYSASEAHTRYYPTHTTNLTMLKEIYDKNRTFNFPQDF